MHKTVDSVLAIEYDSAMFTATKSSMNPSRRVQNANAITNANVARPLHALTLWCAPSPRMVGFTRKHTDGSDAHQYSGRLLN